MDLRSAARRGRPSASMPSPAGAAAARAAASQTGQDAHWRRLTPRCGNLSSQAAALSAVGRGQMLSQALQRKSQAIFLLWLGVST